MTGSFRPGVTLAAALATAALSAQQPQQPTFRGGTNVVRVDLYATRDGKMVDDLKQSEVDVLEDGVKQTIESFERVVVRPPVSQELRAEPNTVAESRQMAADSRARIFVIFLDTYHTSFEDAARLRTALQQFIDRVVGQEDLIGLMTPEMAATDVTLGRRTTVMSRLLDITTWGRRGRLADLDPIEEMYSSCYSASRCRRLSREMIARRREKLALDALDDLVTHLGGLREERKAVLAVTEGWVEYGPNPELARLLKEDEGRIPLPPGGITGRGTTRESGRVQSGVRPRQVQCRSDGIGQPGPQRPADAHRPARQSRERDVLSRRRAGAGRGHHGGSGATRRRTARGWRRRSRNKTPPTCGIARMACGCSPT